MDNEKACGLDYKKEYERMKELLSNSEATVRILQQELENTKNRNKYLEGQVRMAELIFRRGNA